MEESFALFAKLHTRGERLRLKMVLINRGTARRDRKVKSGMGVRTISFGRRIFSMRFLNRWGGHGTGWRILTAAGLPVQWSAL
jgi:hypothetical protein